MRVVLKFQIHRMYSHFSNKRAQVKVGDCNVLNSAFNYIAFRPKWTSCSRLHFQIYNFKVGLTREAHVNKSQLNTTTPCFSEGLHLI